MGWDFVVGDWGRGNLEGGEGGDGIGAVSKYVGKGTWVGSGWVGKGVFGGDEGREVVVLGLGWGFWGGIAVVSRLET